MSEKYPQCEAIKNRIEDLISERARLYSELLETKDPEETAKLTDRITDIDEQLKQIFNEFAECAIEGYLEETMGGTPAVFTGEQVKMLHEACMSKCREKWPSGWELLECIVTGMHSIYEAAKKYGVEEAIERLKRLTPEEFRESKLLKS